MVRRLIRHFLRWLRQILAKFKGAKSRHHSASKRPLPPARNSSFNPQENSRSAFPQPFQSITDSLPQPATSQEASQYPPNPAANRAVNPSNFKVPLSDYRYSPSSAVQSLSQQLTPNTQINFTNDQHQSAIENIPDREKEPNREQPNETAKNNRSLGLKLPPTIADTRQESAITNRQPSQPTPLSLPVETPRSKHTNYAPAPQTTVPAAQSNVIVKQGVIKLLFKLKKNNHHGYVAPDDGSKDIIFHQKYIGDEVFCQLERGIAVEVTAHITEGKAYANHIRIL